MRRRRRRRSRGVGQVTSASPPCRRWSGPDRRACRRSGTPRASCCAGAACRSTSSASRTTGAPRYPEVVAGHPRCAARAPRDVDAVVQAIGPRIADVRRTRRAVDDIARAERGRPRRLRAGPAARRSPPILGTRCGARGSRAWAALGRRFGILPSRPDVEATFAPAPNRTAPARSDRKFSVCDCAVVAMRILAAARPRPRRAGPPRHARWPTTSASPPAAATATVSGTIQ